MLNNIALVLALVATACVADPSGPADAERVVFTPTTHELVAKLQARLLNDQPSADLGADPSATCPIIASEGPCAVACDPDALAELIPAGTCVSFSCEGEDGEDVRVGGCNSGEVSETAPQRVSTASVATDELTRQER